MISPFVKSFSTMVQKGMCAVEQVPADYRDAVAKYLANGEAETFVPVTHTEIPVGKNGALTIPKIDNYIVQWNTLADGSVIDVDFSNADIFSSIIGDNPMPVNPQYSISIIEKMCGVASELHADCTTTDFGFKVRISGSTEELPIGANVLRVDFVIKSDNYEDMKLTVYFCSK